jgi:phosphatidylethanolamine-binding protein (PEBP) family uncharacterized protein
MKRTPLSAGTVPTAVLALLFSLAALQGAVAQDAPPPPATEVGIAQLALTTVPATGGAKPRTPAGPKHRYHIQVFALDNTLAPEALATFATLTEAMKGHVLASGEIIGLGQAAPPAN